MTILPLPYQYIVGAGWYFVKHTKNFTFTLPNIVTAKWYLVKHNYYFTFTLQVYTGSQVVLCQAL